MKIAAILAYPFLIISILAASPCAAQQVNSDACAGSPSVGGNRYGASPALVTATEIDVDLSICWSGPNTEQLGIGFATYSLELRDSSGKLVAKLSHKSKTTPGHAIYIHANDVFLEGTWQAQIPATLALQGRYIATAKQTFVYLLAGQTQTASGTLISAPFQVTIP